MRPVGASLVERGVTDAALWLGLISMLSGRARSQTESHRPDIWHPPPPTTLAVQSWFKLLRPPSVPQKAGFNLLTNIQVWTGTVSGEEHTAQDMFHICTSNKCQLKSLDVFTGSSVLLFNCCSSAVNSLSAGWIVPRCHTGWQNCG